MDQVRDVLDRVAAGQTVDPAALPADIRPLAAVAQLLAAEGRSVDPPAGAFGRARARAAAAGLQGRQSVPAAGWLRPAMVLAMVALMVVGLGGGAYASTPGEPLFQVQRALDDAYVSLPRSADASARVSMGVAERRVQQASAAAKAVTPDVLRGTLDDALRYFARARADIAKLGSAQRHELSGVLGAVEKVAAQRLKETRNEADGANNDTGALLQEIEHELDQHGDHDTNDGEQNSPDHPADHPAGGTTASGPTQTGGPSSDGGPAGSDAAGPGNGNVQGSGDGQDQGDEGTK